MEHDTDHDPGALLAGHEFSGDPLMPGDSPARPAASLVSWRIDERGLQEFARHARDLTAEQDQALTNQATLDAVHAVLRRRDAASPPRRESA